MKINKENLLNQDRLILRSTENRPNIKAVILRIKGREKIIANIDSSGEGTLIAEKKENHLFKKTNSLGFPYALLENDDIQFKWINIGLQGHRYCTSRKYFLHFGHFRRYGDFELQIILPLDKFGINAAREFEAKGPAPEQQNLFEVA